MLSTSYRRMILASGMEGMEGFRQKWSLHGHLEDSRYFSIFLLGLEVKLLTIKYTRSRFRDVVLGLLAISTSMYATYIMLLYLLVWLTS